MNDLNSPSQQGQDPLAKYVLLNRTDDIALHLVHAALVLLCVIVLYRTAAGLKNARFLRHLAVSFLFAACFYLGSVVVVFIQFMVALSAHRVAGGGPPSASSINAAVAGAERIGRAWSAIETVLSFTSSFWLLIVIDLIRKHPQEGISRSRYSALLGVFGGIFAILFSVAQAHDAALHVIVSFVDVVLASVCITLVGWRLHAKFTPKVLAPIVRSFTLVAFIAWGVLQLPYAVTPLLSDGDMPQWLQMNSSYHLGLMLSALASAISAAIISALSLEENPAFQFPPMPSERAATGA
jgi:hypothetical protein